jgi:son of sevenless-like protein
MSCGAAHSLISRVVELGAKPKRGKKGKLEKILGELPPAHWEQKETPWYLKPDYVPSDIILDNVEGSIKAGTIQALVERLTAHDNTGTSAHVFIDDACSQSSCSDMKLPKEFMLTWKSFTDLDTLFDCLVQRYRILPPDGLKPEELEDWTKTKQVLVRAR